MGITQAYQALPTIYQLPRHQTRAGVSELLQPVYSGGLSGVGALGRSGKSRSRILLCKLLFQCSFTLQPRIDMRGSFLRGSSSAS